MSDFGEPLKDDPAIISAADKDTRQWSMFLHFSMLANCVLPIAGIIAPIVIWQIKKEDLPAIDVHGKNAVNWIISAAIYSIVSGLLVFFVVGFFLLLALGICSVVFPIIAGIKANNGIVWKYPLTYDFLK